MVDLSLVEERIWSFCEKRITCANYRHLIEHFPSLLLFSQVVPIGTWLHVLRCARSTLGESIFHFDFIFQLKRLSKKRTYLQLNPAALRCLSNLSRHLATQPATLNNSVKKNQNRSSRLYDFHVFILACICETQSLYFNLLSWFQCILVKLELSISKINPAVKKPMVGIVQWIRLKFREV